MPEGLRDRIKEAAERSGRSMNAEILQALEQHFPPQPSIFEVLERVHEAIDLAQQSNGLPYRRMLIESLDELSERVSSGLETDQFVSMTLPNHHKQMSDFTARFKRWKRASEYGVELSDLKRELERGLFANAGHDKIALAIKSFKEGDVNAALKLFRLDKTKFAEPEKSYQAIEDHLRNFYAENWGPPDSAGEF